MEVHVRVHVLRSRIFPKISSVLITIFKVYSTSNYINTCNYDNRILNVHKDMIPK